jgi:hypothetical protein
MTAFSVRRPATEIMDMASQTCSHAPAWEHSFGTLCVPAVSPLHRDPADAERPDGHSHAGAQEREPGPILPSVSAYDLFLLFLRKIARRDNRQPCGIEVVAQGSINGLWCQRLDLLFEIGLELHGPAQKEVFSE